MLLEPDYLWPTSASARLSKNQLWVHIVAVFLKNRAC